MESIRSIGKDRCRHRHGGWCSICGVMVPRPDPRIRDLVSSGAIANTLGIALLARQFHVLDKFPIFDSRVDTINGRTLRKLLRDCYSDAEAHAVRFLLNVWNTSHATSKATRFDVVRAMSNWDEGNRAAFLSWARDPWWA